MDDLSGSLNPHDSRFYNVLFCSSNYKDLQQFDFYWLYQIWIRLYGWQIREEFCQFVCKSMYSCGIPQPPSQMWPTAVAVYMCSCWLCFSIAVLCLKEAQPGMESSPAPLSCLSSALVDMAVCSQVLSSTGSVYLPRTHTHFWHHFPQPELRSKASK